MNRLYFLSAMVNILTFVSCVFTILLNMMNQNTNIDIVIADDDLEDLELLQTAILSVEPQAQLHLFNDGVSALQYLLGNESIQIPSLIIFDYNMPAEEWRAVVAFS